MNDDLEKRVDDLENHYEALSRVPSRLAGISDELDGQARLVRGIGDECRAGFERVNKTVATAVQEAVTAEFAKPRKFDWKLWGAIISGVGMPVGAVILLFIPHG